jgi:deoxycytidylate deaminase
MPDTLDLAALTGQYREELLARENTARLALLKNYRGAWRGLESSIDETLGQLKFDAVEQAEINSAVIQGEAGAPVKISADKVSQVADLLLRKRDWRALEEKVDTGFSDVAGQAAKVTDADRLSLGQLAITHAIEILDMQLGPKKTADKKKLSTLHQLAVSDMQFIWLAKREKLQEIFKKAAETVAERARRALRQEVVIAILTRARGAEILSRVKRAIDQRESDPDKDPALVIALRSEYRVATIESYRAGLLQTFRQSSDVKAWRWTTERKPRTCVICLGMDGQIFPLGQVQTSHPNCRCTLVPVTEKEAAQLTRKTAGGSSGGSTTDNSNSSSNSTGETETPLPPPQTISTAEETFAGFSEPQQLAALGAKAFEAYQKGEFELSDLIGVQYSEKLGTETLYRKSLDDTLAAVKKTEGRIYVQEQNNIEQAYRARTAQMKMAKADFSNYEPLDINYDLKYKSATPDEMHDLKTGFSGGDYWVPVDIQILKELPDARYELLRIGLLIYANQFNIPASAVETYLKEELFDGQPITKENAVIDLGSMTSESADGLRKKLNERWDEIWKDLQKGKKPKPYVFKIFAAARLKLYEIYVRDSGDPRLQRNFRLEKVLRDTEAALGPEPAEPLARAFWDMHRQIVLKDTIRDFYENENADFRATGNESQNLGNKIADGLESFINAAINMHPVLGPILSYAPGLKQQIINFGVGAVNGGAELAGMVQGGYDAAADAFFDIMVTAARKTGLAEAMGPNFDVFVAANQKYRDKRAEAWSALTNLQTVNMGKQNEAYYKIKSLGIPTVPWDTPNWSATAGKMGVEAIPFIALAVATGGASVPVQIGVMTAVSGGAAFNLAYVKTNDYKIALESGVTAAVQAGLGGLSGRLPGIGNFIADAMTTYVFGKIAGQDDDVIFQQMILQTGIGLTTQGAMKGYEKLRSRESFSPGGEMNDKLTDFANSTRPEGSPEITQLSLKGAQEVFMRMMKDTFAQGMAITADKAHTALQIDVVTKKIARTNEPLVGGQKRLLAEYGSQNSGITKKQADTAQANLEKFIGQNKANPDVDLSSRQEVADLAAYHVEAGAVNFPDFVRVMRSYRGGKTLTLEHLQSIYENAIQTVKTAKTNANRPAAEIAKITPDENGIAQMKKDAARITAKTETPSTKPGQPKENTPAAKTDPSEKTPVQKPGEKTSGQKTDKTGDNTSGTKPGSTEPTKEPANPQDKSQQKTQKPEQPSKPPQAMQKQKEVLARREALQTEGAKRAYDELFGSTTKNKPTRAKLKRFEQNVEDLAIAAKKTGRTHEEVLENLKAVADERKRLGLPPYEYLGKKNGTVARIADTDAFGANTNAKGGRKNPDNEAPRREAFEQLKEKGLVDRNSTFKDKYSRFLTHAEADSLIQASKANGGKFPDEVTMYVDRRTCTRYCIDTKEGNIGLSKLAGLYDIKKLTIIDSLGNQFIVQPGKETVVIERQSKIDAPAAPKKVNKLKK